MGANGYLIFQKRRTRKSQFYKCFGTSCRFTSNSYYWGYPLISWHRYGKLPIYVHIYIYMYIIIIIIKITIITIFWLFLSHFIYIYIDIYNLSKKRWFSVAIRWNFRSPYCWGPTWREMGRRHHEVFALGWGNGWGLLRNHQKAVQSTGNCWGTTSFTGVVSRVGSQWWTHLNSLDPPKQIWDQIIFLF